MKPIISLIILLFFLNVQAQTPNNYSRVQIDLQGVDIREIAALGLEVDHGVVSKGRHIINDYSDREIALLDQYGFNYEILIDDVQAHYVQQNKNSVDNGSQDDNRGEGDCGSNVVQEYITPENYADGSMGGYFTYEEMLATLDSMVSKYPNLITPIEPIDTILTHEGRPIYWLRVSDNPNENEEEPELLYTALHHAREPNSLSQMIFYLWYLLENYDIDEEVQYLVNNTEMYFIPCINPDGYVYNQTVAPDGGGGWRKNRWADEDGTIYGVDLNRNYDYQWGFDNSGSSPDYEDETFRGLSGFSEPETQAVREFCNEHEFRITLNYHTFGNLLIHPWGYSDERPDEYETFKGIGEEMTRYNNFLLGTGTETVGYVVNGDSDDWMFGDTINKPAIIAFTPEVGSGSHGFWPPQSAIDGYNKSCMYQNLIAAHMVLNFGEVREVEGMQFIAAMLDTLKLNLKKISLQEGELTLSVTTGSENLVIESDAFTREFVHLEEATIPFAYSLSESVKSGDEIIFLIHLDNGQFIKTDTLKKVFLEGEMISVFSEDGTDVSNWQVDGQWSETNAEFFSAPTSITDSPDEEYSNSSNTSISILDPIDLNNAKAAILTFMARWDIEPGWDYAQVMASTDGVNYTALCGNYTVIGNDNQDEGESLYDGTQTEWVEEEINLSDYIGNDVWLRFRLVSDNYVTEDGFYFDDLNVNIVTGANGLNEEIVDIAEANFKVHPNPVVDQLQIEFEMAKQFKQAEICITNPQGQRIGRKVLNGLSVGSHHYTMDIGSLAEGIYLLKLKLDDGTIISRRVIKIK